MPRILSTLASAAVRVAADVREAFDELFPPVVASEVKTAEDEGWHIDPPHAYCHRCGATVGPGEATDRGCSRCVSESIPWDGLIRLAAYKPPVSGWLVAMKFHRVWSWGPWFGRQLAERVQSVADPSRTIVCPVPMPALRRWRRGYNQADLIAQAFADRLQLPCAHLLRRRGRQTPQTNVPPSQRAANVRHAFAMERVDPAGWHVWLIDDVKTTGSTLGACVRLLKSAGVASVNIAVAAVADPKNADFKVK